MHTNICHQYLNIICQALIRSEKCVSVSRYLNSNLQRQMRLVMRVHVGKKRAEVERTRREEVVRKRRAEVLTTRRAEVMRTMRAEAK